MSDIVQNSFQIHKASNIVNGKMIGLLHDYWDFIDFDSREYRFTKEELRRKYNISRLKDIDELACGLGFVKINKIMECQTCARELFIFNRNEMLLYSEGGDDQKRCVHSCVKCFGYTYAQNANIFMLLLELLISKRKLEIANTKRENLSHIEKLLFIVFLQDRRIDHSDIKEHDLNAFINSESNESRSVFNALIKKGYIDVYNYAGDIKVIANILANILVDSKGRLHSDELRNRIENAISNSTRICAVLPCEYETYNDYSAVLCNDLLTANVDAFDVKQIDNYVRCKRLLEIKSIFEKICKDNEIPFRDDNALRITLEKMVDRFNLNECNNILNYRSVYVVHSMHRAKINRIERYRIQHYFRNNLTNYMQYFDKNENAKRYEKPLDIDWVIPQIEAFVSLNIIKENIFWADFTAQEITAKWVSALCLQPGCCENR